MSRVLFVNCETHLADLCTASLEKRGHQVICVDGYGGAQDFSLKEKVDLAIVRLHSDEIEGLEFFKQLSKSNPALAGILISGDASLDLIVEAMNCGFSKICREPLEIDELLELVHVTLKRTSLTEEVTRMKTLLPLYKLGKSFLKARTEQAIYDHLVEVVCQETGVPKVSVMMFDEKTESLKVMAFRGLDAEIIKNLELKPGERIAGKVFASKLPAILNKDNQSGPYVDLLKRKELEAAISFPMPSSGKVLGVLNVSETRGGVSFSDADIEMLSIISDQAMMALENIRSMHERDEQNRIRTLIEQYVSPEVSRLLAQSSLTSMEQGTVQDLTVLFADIRNFTLLVQLLPPEQTRNFLNEFFENFATTVFSQHGMVDKFMGDAALAVFGAPIKLDNAPLAAVAAAQSIRSEFDKLQQRWCLKNIGFKKIGLGIGISNGPIFLGNVGFTKRLDYTVIGTDVNIAQRLASKSKSGQVLITRSVRELLGDDYPVQSEMQMSLRGIEGAITVFSV